MFCARCGKPHPNAAKFCPECGAPIGRDTTTPSSGEIDGRPTTASAPDTVDLAKAELARSTRKGLAIAAAAIILCVLLLVGWQLNGPHSSGDRAPVAAAGGGAGESADASDPARSSPVSQTERESAATPSVADVPDAQTRASKNKPPRNDDFFERLFGQSGGGIAPTPGRAVARSEASRPSAVVNLQRLSAPNGDFIITAPPGWGFQSNQSENPITVAPVGAVAPAATIWVAIRVTALAEEMLAANALARAGTSLNACGPLAETVSAHTTRWTAGDALDLIVAYLRTHDEPTAKLVSKRMISQGSAEAIVDSISQGVPVQSAVILSMDYFQDSGYTMQVALMRSQCPAIRALPAWESFGSLVSCRAPAGTVANWEPACAEIFASFQPLDNWLVAYGQQVSNEIGAAGGQVNNIVSQIRRAGQMQLQSQLDYMNSNWRTQRRRADALGGYDRVRDAHGQEYQVPSGFKRYCKESGGRIRGTNDLFDPNCVELSKVPVLRN